MKTALACFTIAAQVGSDEPLALTACDDLANFARHRDSSFLRNQAHFRHIGNGGRLFVVAFSRREGQFEA